MTKEKRKPKRDHARQSRLFFFVIVGLVVVLAASVTTFLLIAQSNIEPMQLTATALWATSDYETVYPMNYTIDPTTEAIEGYWRATDSAIRHSNCTERRWGYGADWGIWGGDWSSPALEWPHALRQAGVEFERAGVWMTGEYGVCLEDDSVADMERMLWVLLPVPNSELDNSAALADHIVPILHTLEQTTIDNVVALEITFRAANDRVLVWRTGADAILQVYRDGVRGAGLYIIGAAQFYPDAQSAIAAQEAFLHEMWATEAAQSTHPNGFPTSEARP